MPVVDDDPLRDFPDRAIRELLAHPQHLRSLLRRVVPTLADGFDCERRESLDREFPLDDWRRRQSDLLYRIPYRSAAGEVSAFVCVLIEHQSQADPLMPLRTLLYAVYRVACARLGPLFANDKSRWYDLLRLMYTWGMWRRPRAERERLHRATLESQSDAARLKGVQTMSQTIAEWYIEQGERKGEKKGEKKGYGPCKKRWHFSWKSGFRNCRKICGGGSGRPPV